MEFLSGASPTRGMQTLCGSDAVMGPALRAAALCRVQNYSQQKAEQLKIGGFSSDLSEPGNMPISQKKISRVHEQATF